MHEVQRIGLTVLPVIRFCSGFGGGIRRRWKAWQAGRCAWMNFGFIRNEISLMRGVANKSGVAVASVGSQCKAKALFIRK
jgi:hypothetical protein